MIVYKLTNKINGKVYIGITTKMLRVRMNSHWQCAKGGIKRPLYNAIRKYGMESFEAEILANAKDIDELKELEIHFIQTHDSRSREKGYNVSSGGEGAYRGKAYSRGKSPLF